MNLDCIDNRCGDGESASPEMKGVAQPWPLLGEERTPMLLSKRQQEILAAACLGKPDKVIADDLGVSLRTMEGHWRAIHRKLGSVNRCQAGFLFAALRETTHGKTLA
jgi:DNA-binding NarL/FixJ family response regulator